MFKQWIFYDIIPFNEPGQLLLVICGKEHSKSFKKIVAGATLRRKIVTEGFSGLPGRIELTC